MDPNSIMQEIGGGLPSVVIVSLAIAVIFLWRTNAKLQADRIADHKAHTTQLMDMMQSVDRAMEFVRSRDA